MDRLLELYRKTKGGHKLLSDDDFAEYAALRKLEYQTRKDELQTAGKKNVKVVKSDDDDIIGWTWEDEISSPPE